MKPPVGWGAGPLLGYPPPSNKFADLGGGLVIQSDLTSLQVSPITHIGVCADCDTSNKLYNNDWFLWLVNRSNSSRINRTDWLSCPPKETIIIIIIYGVIISWIEDLEHYITTVDKAGLEEEWRGFKMISIACLGINVKLWYYFFQEGMVANSAVSMVFSFIWILPLSQYCAQCICGKWQIYKSH